MFEDTLIVELKTAKALANEHEAQILGYLKSARHGLLINFGFYGSEIRKFAWSEHSRKQQSGSVMRLVSALFALQSVRVFARREDFLAQCGRQRVAQTAESVVSPVANRRVRANGWGVKAQPTPLFHRTPAGWQRAIRQVGNLRYFGCGSAALCSLRLINDSNV